MRAGPRAMNAAISSSGSAVEVGLFGLQTIASRVATVISRGHRGEVVALVAVERHADLGRARRGREVRVDRERRPRVDELGAGLEQRLAGGQQDLDRPVADRDARGGHAVAVAQRGAQRGCWTGRGSG